MPATTQPTEDGYPHRVVCPSTRTAELPPLSPAFSQDAAIILLGYASVMRRSEMVALTLADVEHKPAGLLLTVRRSKTDQAGDGRQVPVAHGQHAVTDPVAALAAWRAVRGEAPGPLFTRIWASSVSLVPLSGHVVLVNRYIRPLEALATTSSKDPGL